MPFDVTIFSDTLVEGDETVNLMANSPSNFAVVDPDSATLVIVDDDSEYSYILNISSYMYIVGRRFLLENNKVLPLIGSALCQLVTTIIVY